MAAMGKVGDHGRRNAEAFEEEIGHQRGAEKTAGQRVDAEQRGDAPEDAAALRRNDLTGDGGRLTLVGEARVERQADNQRQRLEQEGQAKTEGLVDIERMQQLRHARHTSGKGAQKGGDVDALAVVHGPVVFRSESALALADAARRAVSVGAWASTNSANARAATGR